MRGTCRSSMTFCSIMPSFVRPCCATIVPGDAQNRYQSVHMCVMLVVFVAVSLRDKHQCGGCAAKLFVSVGGSGPCSAKQYRRLWQRSSQTSESLLFSWSATSSSRT
ncbi:uncharacterized protein BT62DRAFT_381111 [Guyanagaster necrorhizus]|uniref:Secreted protein n=1 Tax=Guyanagaster necrorhizus TaxID=856835 RepID=A0A9P7VLY9_9AGAR|nr:uncharacterized protein BT62DRAFT_381111 [Guyanagaster necrorhizus MCA 3950]KAG7442391.1 hypothetical protein BT62DRAFT_381111 [Guyanagaster necrorhizus MCA 3950]